MPFIQRLVQPTFLSRRCTNGGATATPYPFTASSKESSSVVTSSTSLSTHHNIHNGISSLAISGSAGVAVTSSAIPGNASGVTAIESSCNSSTNANADDVITCGEFSGAVDNRSPALNGKSGSMHTATTGTTKATSTSSTRESMAVTRTTTFSTAMAISDNGSSSEFETMTNITLSNALRQMASILIIANEIFLELNGELQNIANRSQGLKEKIII